MADGRWGRFWRATREVVNAYFATGGSDWHAGNTSIQSLLKGWRAGCETPPPTW